MGPGEGCVCVCVGGGGFHGLDAAVPAGANVAWPSLGAPSARAGGRARSALSASQAQNRTARKTVTAMLKLSLLYRSKLVQMPCCDVRTRIYG